MLCGAKVTDEPTKIAILAFDGITALDLVGPYEALSRVPNVEISVCGKAAGVCRTEAGTLGVVADLPISSVSGSDILLVPGGGPKGISMLIQDGEILEWIRSMSREAKWTASVCTGSLVLGAAGLLENRNATTHWRAKDFLPRFGATYVNERVVESEKILTAAGVTAGIELGLRLVEKIAGLEIARAVELSMHYDPKPPFGTGSPKKADSETIQTAVEGLAKYS